MSNESVLRTDILTEDLTESQQKTRLIVGTQFKTIVDAANRYDKTTTPKPTKNINETMAIIKEAIEHRENTENKTADARVVISYDEPDTVAELETISISLISRVPGQFDRGPPMEGRIRQLRPMLREIKDDREHPGYKIAIFGYWYDNILQLTPWARTNKTANERALWLEELMEDYAWFFGYRGVNRSLIYQGRGKEKTLNVQGNKLYGRPLNYFVRTERLLARREKTLEDILIYLQIIAE